MREYKDCDKISLLWEKLGIIKLNGGFEISKTREHIDSTHK